MLAFTMKHIL